MDLKIHLVNHADLSPYMKDRLNEYLEVEKGFNMM